MLDKRIDPKLQNRHEVVIGASGSGKSSYIKQHHDVVTARRIMIWDPDGEYRAPHVNTVPQLLRVCNKAGFGPLKVAIACNPSTAEFEQFCAIAFRMGHARAPLVVITEELADVANIGKASPQWGQLIRKGRKYGIQLFVASQRPQEIDKTVFSQCGTHWCGQLREERTRKYMADTIGVSVAAIAALKPLDYYLKSSNDDATKHRIKF